ncbi:MAG: hypothetical protein AVDCRST_MAG91-3433, partial [uncultured Sphingomonadaceae bacterium]
PGGRCGGVRGGLPPPRDVGAAAQPALRGDRGAGRGGGARGGGAL